MNFGGVTIRPNNNKIVIHKIRSVYAKTIADESLFSQWVVDQEYIDVTTFTQRQRLTSAYGDDLHLHVMDSFKFWQDNIKQARIVSACSCGESQRYLPR
jgi:hypothetical protein